MNLLKKLMGVAAVVVLAGILPACGSTEPSDAALVSEDITVGFGATAVTGDTATVSYVGKLTNGTTFDSGNFTFRIGAGQVIKGWDQGVPGMKVGGKRKLTIPPSLAYGSSGSGPIPGNSTLIFEITLLALAGK